MQVLALKMHNFMRFASSNNTIVFDTPPRYFQNKENTLDMLYQKILANPYAYYLDIKESGLNSLIGILGVVDNNSEESNGAGKSTIMEAMCYAHYGKIVRLTANSENKGDAGSLVANTNPTIEVDDFWVEEIFESGGKVYRIKRGRSFSKSKKTSSPILEFEVFDEKGVTKEQGHRSSETKLSIEEVNEYPYDLFVNTKMFGQNDSGKFLTGTDKTRKEMIIEALQCKDEVQRCQEKIRKKKMSIDREMVEIQNSINEISKNVLTIYSKYTNKSGTISEVNSTEFSFASNERIDKFKFDNIDIDRQLVDISAKISTLNPESLNKELDGVRKELDAVKQIAGIKKKSYDTLRESISSGLRSNNISLEDCVSQLRGLDARISSIDASISKNRSFIASVNVDEVKLNLEKSRKAKELSGQSAKDLEQIVCEVNDLKNKIGILDFSMISRKNDLKYFVDQTKNINDGVLHCPECRSLVPLSHFESKISEYTKCISDLEGQIQALNTSMSEKTSLKDKIETKNKNILLWIGREAEFAKTLDSCVLAEQSIPTMNSDKDEILKNKTLLFDRRKSLEESKLDFEQQLIKAESEFNKSVVEEKDKFVDLSTKLKDLEANFSKISTEVSKLNNDTKDLNSKKSKNSEHVGLVKKEIDIFNDSMNRISVKTAELDGRIKEYTRYDKLDSVFGLDGIQTKIVHKYLPVLNMYLVEFVGILSNNLISVELVIDSNSDVNIKISGATSEIYKMLSGGEKMLVHTAMNLALAMLSFVRTKNAPSMICLDEIFAPLDQKHKKCVFRLLESLNKRFSRVLLITHDDALKKQIPCNIIVSKEFGISKIKEFEYNEH